MKITVSTPREVVGCPEPDQLHRYLTGWMPEDEYEQTDSHVLDCARCESTLATLEESSDTLVELLRRRDADGVVDTAPVVKDAIERARDLMDARPSLSVWTPPTDRVASYDLIEPLGRGGMATVFLARHRELQKLVAIKLLPSDSSRREEFDARFSREVLAVGSLNDPRIVAATDAGEIEQARYLVMEYVSGMDLSRIARAVGKLSIADACAIARQVALGLSTAHAEGIVHRDIKPSNIMLDDAGQVKILDFGLAQLDGAGVTPPELTTVGQLLGTLDYMAPEQAERSGEVDYRADLYSLGATLFRLLTGRAPLAASPNQSPLEKLRLLANHSAPGLAGLRADAPEELTGLVRRLLTSNPAERPASAAHVADELEALAEDSDLPALVVGARQREAESPPPISRQWNGVIPAPQNQMRSRIRSPWSWVLGALAALVIVAGVMITIRTQKGQIVIQSDVADVRVRILKDGEEVEGLRIRQGAESTKLWAGKYEVVIDGASEDLMVEGGTLTLKRGGTAVARIVQKSATAEPVSRGVNESLVGDAPTYNGKTLDEWLALLRRERSPDTVLDCYDAIARLRTPESLETINSSILHVMRVVPNERITHGKSTRNTDSEAIELLRYNNPDRAFWEWIVTQLSSGDEAWQLRLLSRCDLRNDAPEHWQPMREWLARHLQSPSPASPTGEALAERAGRFALDAGIESKDAAIGEAMLKLLIDSPTLNHSWWLKLGPIEPSGWRGSASPHTDYPPLIRAEIERRAMGVLENAEPAADSLAQAAMVLTSKKEHDGRSRVRIANALVRQFKRLAVADERLTLVSVPYAYAPLTPPRVGRGHTVGVTTRAGRTQANTIGELLDLAAETGLAGKLDSSMKVVLACLEIAEEETVGHHGGQIAVSWPSLQSNVRFGRRQRPQLNLKKLVGSRLMREILYEHPMVGEYRTRLAEEKEQADGAP